MVFVLLVFFDALLWWDVGLFGLNSALLWFVIVFVIFRWLLADFQDWILGYLLCEVGCVYGCVFVGLRIC